MLPSCHKSEISSRNPDELIRACEVSEGVPLSDSYRTSPACFNKAGTLCLLTEWYYFICLSTTVSWSPSSRTEDGHSRGHSTHGQHGGQRWVAGWGLPQVRFWMCVCVRVCVSEREREREREREKAPTCVFRVYVMSLQAGTNRPWLCLEVRHMC